MRNYFLIGSVFGLGAEMQSTPSLVAQKTLLSPYFTHQFLPRVYSSFIADLGFSGLPVPPVSAFYLLVIAVSVAGIAVYLIRTRMGDTKINLSLLLVASCFGGIVYYNLKFSQPHGRLMFPVISSIAILIALGLRVTISDIVSERVANVLNCGVMCCLAVCDVVAILWAHSFYYNIENYVL